MVDEANIEGQNKQNAGGGIRLPPNKLKDVMSNWEHLDLPKIIARVAEFFSELPARASANVKVNWASTGKHGFATVNHLISCGEEISHFMRVRTAGYVKRLRTKYGVKVTAAQAVMAVQPNIAPTIR